MKRLFLVVLVLLTLVGNVALGQETSSDKPVVDDEAAISRTTMEVSTEVMSPFCPGKTLAMCPSPAAAEVRRDIQTMASEGKNADEIKRTLIEKYGDEFELVEPSASDNALVLGLIVAGGLLCLFVVVMISRRRKSGKGDDDQGDEGDEGDDEPKEGTPKGTDGEVDDPYLRALRDEYRS